MSGGGRGALQMRFHFGERDRDGGGPLDAAVMDACARHGVWAAALLRGIEGFGARQSVRTERLLSLSEDAPLVATAVGEARAIEELAAEVKGIAAGGLVVLEEVEVVGGGAVGDAGVGPTGTATPSAAEVAVPVGGVPGVGARDVVRATVWGPRTGASAPHLAAVDALYRHGAEAATVLLGVDGVLGGERRRARFVAGNRGVPAITVAVGERGAIGAALAEVDGVANLVTIEGVEDRSRKARERLHTDGGVERNRPYAAEKLHTDGGVERKLPVEPPSLHGGTPRAAAEGARVTLVTSEIARCGAHPLYLALIREWRRGGATGATALRGVWGFRGEVEPHGDRVLALRRDVPLIVETVDTAERAARWLGVAESLAGESDIVYSQPIPRILAVE